MTLMGLSSLAFAGDHDWIGFAGLADADKDGYPAFVGKSTAVSTGYTSKLDCDDQHNIVYPGATEVVADGIDQDCNGNDLVLPISQPAWVLFVKNEYSGTAPSAGRFVYEHDQCTAAAGKCVVDKIDGRFKVTGDGVQLKDIYVNGGKELRNNGQKADGREIVSDEEIQHYRDGSASGSGLRTKAITKIAKAEAVATVQVETDQRIAGQLDLAEKIVVLTKENIRIVGLISTERSVREEAVRLQLVHNDNVEKKADGAVATANSTASHGPLIEGYALTGVVVGSVVTDDGEFVRYPVGIGGGGGVNFGADLESSRVNVFIDALIGADGGAGPAHSEAIGLEIVSKKGWGGFAAYSSRSSQPNSLETDVLSRNPLLGVSFLKTFAENGARHGLFQVRAGLGPEFIGMSDYSEADNVSDRIGLAGRITVSVGGGIGALK